MQPYRTKIWNLPYHCLFLWYVHIANARSTVTQRYIKGSVQRVYLEPPDRNDSARRFVVNLRFRVPLTLLHCTVPSFALGPSASVCYAQLQYKPIPNKSKLNCNTKITQNQRISSFCRNFVPLPVFCSLFFSYTCRVLIICNLPYTFLLLLLFNCSSTKRAG